MQFRILGPPDLYDEATGRSVPLNAPKTRLLLGTLLARPNAPVARETLVRELWGTAPRARCRTPSTPMCPRCAPGCCRPSRTGTALRG